MALMYYRDEPSIWKFSKNGEHKPMCDPKTPCKSLSTPQQSDYTRFIRFISEDMLITCSCKGAIELVTPYNDGCELLHIDNIICDGIRHFLLSPQNNFGLVSNGGDLVFFSLNLSNQTASLLFRYDTGNSGFLSIFWPSEREICTNVQTGEDQSVLQLWKLEFDKNGLPVNMKTIPFSLHLKFFVRCLLVSSYLPGLMILGDHIGGVHVHSLATQESAGDHVKPAGYLIRSFPKIHGRARVTDIKAESADQLVSVGRNGSIARFYIRKDAKTGVDICIQIVSKLFGNACLNRLYQTHEEQLPTIFIEKQIRYDPSPVTHVSSFIGSAQYALFCLETKAQIFLLPLEGSTVRRNPALYLRIASDNPGAIPQYNFAYAKRKELVWRRSLDFHDPNNQQQLSLSNVRLGCPFHGRGVNDCFFLDASNIITVAEDNYMQLTHIDLSAKLPRSQCTQIQVEHSFRGSMKTIAACDDLVITGGAMSSLTIWETYPQAGAIRLRKLRHVFHHTVTESRIIALCFWQIDPVKRIYLVVYSVSNAEISLARFDRTSLEFRDVAHLRFHSVPAFAVASLRACTFASAANDGSVAIWSIAPEIMESATDAEFQPIWADAVHGSSINALSSVEIQGDDLDQEGTLYLIATAGDDECIGLCLVRVLSASSAQLIAKLKKSNAHRAAVTGIYLHRTGLLISVGADQRLNCWNVLWKQNELMLDLNFVRMLNVEDCQCIQAIMHDENKLLAAVAGVGLELFDFDVHSSLISIANLQ